MAPSRSYSPAPLLVLLVALVSCSDDDQPTGPGPDVLLQLTNTDAAEATPCWSPDGRDIAYSSTPPSGQSDLWRVSVAGGPATRLTEMGGACPAWSPDGERIAFDSVNTNCWCVLWMPAADLDSDDTFAGLAVRALGKCQEDPSQIGRGLWRNHRWRRIVEPGGGGHRVFAATNGRGVYRFDGTAWEPSGLAGAFVPALRSVDPVLLASSALDGLFLSSDHGQTWDDQ